MRIRTFALVLATACALTIAACGGDDNAGGATKAPGSTGAATAEATNAAGATSPGAAKLPSDACALLTLQEVQTVAPGASAGAASNDAALAAHCYWAAKGTDGINVEVTVLAVSGGNLSGVKSSVLVAAKDPKVNGAEIAGVGDVAAFTSTVGVDAEARAVVKGVLLSVTLNGLNARAQKDKVIALLKAAAGRM